MKTLILYWYIPVSSHFKDEISILPDDRKNNLPNGSSLTSLSFITIPDPSPSPASCISWLFLAVTDFSLFRCQTSIISCMQTDIALLVVHLVLTFGFSNSFTVKCGPQTSSININISGLRKTNRKMKASEAKFLSEVLFLFSCLLVPFSYIRQVIETRHFFLQCASKDLLPLFS